MTSETETYADFGIRTLNGAYWLLVFFTLMAANVIVFYGVRTHDVIRTATAGFWWRAQCAG